MQNERGSLQRPALSRKMGTARYWNANAADMHSDAETGLLHWQCNISHSGDPGRWWASQQLLSGIITCIMRAQGTGNLSCMKSKAATMHYFQSRFGGPNLGDSLPDVHGFLRNALADTKFEKSSIYTAVPTVGCTECHRSREYLLYLPS